MSLSYSQLIAELRRRSSRAHASLLAPSTLPLRRWLETHLGGPAGSDDGLLGVPIFEHKFGYKRAPQTMAELAATGRLHPALVAQMDAPPKEFAGQAFPRTSRPYSHQVGAWTALRRPEPRSVVVAAGTGSGKTECFLVPILDDLARQAQTAHGPLEGVQALLLYPLNALINSQRERLSAWTRGFAGKVRYCLYNGETPERPPRQDEVRASPEQVLSRRALRAEPPPLLITNATMLEYMLVRPEDREILQKSRGRLRYVVIDEAHTYVGSAAAELALLIRRVMNAFEVDPAQVRFVATSATLSSGDAAGGRAEIQQFLADVAGQPTHQVEVFVDEREIPELPEVPLTSDWPDLDPLAALSPEERYQRLLGDRGARLLRGQLTRGARTVAELGAALEAYGIAQSPDSIVRLLDLAKDARPQASSGEPPEPFLPLRGHVMMRGLPGLWACTNPACQGRTGPDLSDEAWPFGCLFTSRRSRCPHCEAQVLELVLCQQCGSEYLLAQLVRTSEDFDIVRPIAFDEVTDPPDETEDPDPGDDTGDEVPDEADGLHASREKVRLVGRRRARERASERLDPEMPIDPATGALDEGEHRFSLVQPDPKLLIFECPHCGQRDRSVSELFFRSCRTGRDFVLGIGVPVLLEQMRPEPEPNTLPFGGRKTISFTDSRQGTARFAARAQGEAERNYVRSFVYHTVLDAQGQGPSKVEGLKSQLATLLALPPETRTALAGTIGELTQKIAEAERGVRVPVQTIANALAQAPNFQQLVRFWKDYLPFTEAKISEDELARWLVLREFARRPMRRASLETLGLISVRFANLDLVRPPPLAWQRWAGQEATASWHAFLKLLLDYYVRSNSAVRLDPKFFRWVGTTILPKVVAGPGKAPLRYRRISWPRFTSRSRLPLLVVRAFDLDPEDPAVRADLEGVLEEAWDFVKPALARTEDGRQLIMDKMELELVREAWICPLTRMLLDTTLLGHTPYQPPLGQVFDTRARKVTMPVPPEAFGEGLAQWFESDETVSRARAAGAISEFTERVLTVAPYFQVAEHSAQLPGRTLKKTERRFKEGSLNLLSCSTTMEMGVDIGGLGGVAMNNAPPSPANFLQRVGRAGRRGESAAVSLTVCRHLPHDQAVFAHPEWPFRTPIHIAAVRLDSERIVERHVRSAILSRFLLTQVQPQTILRLECAWFFVVPEGQTESVYDRLLTWLYGSGPSDAPSDAELATHLERITRATALGGVPSGVLLASAEPAFRAAAEAFDRVRRNLLEQRASLPEEEREDSPAAYAIRRQLARLEKEYLLRYLADQQVLPGYGFPTGVVQLVTTTVEELKALKAADDQAKARKKAGTPESQEERQEREDARAQLMGYPSRDLSMALREYAPGNKVVIERRTYTPRGVTLNWHLPASGESTPNEDQALKKAWTCPRCGMGGSSSADAPRECPSCSHSKLDVRQYLEPAGFAVDLFRDAEIDAAPPVYIPVEDPWISSGEGRFELLGHPVRVRVRHTPNGEIMHLSHGLHGHGYAICLKCGRAEPETEANASGDHKDLVDHLRLRGGKGWKDENLGARCEGNDSKWAIKHNLALGGTERTDVLELNFLDPTTNHLVADEVLLTTLAVALRKEAARAIGIDDRELGYQVAPRILDGQRGFAVLLYDTASGGAGFCAELPAMLPGLLRRAVEACRCPRDCSGACHSCLLSHDTQHDMHRIDRFRLAPRDGSAPAILDEAYLASLELPSEHRVFGPSTALVWGEPQLAVIRQARRMCGPGRPLQVQLHACGDADDLDPVRWSGRPLVRSLAALGQVSITLVLPESSLPTEWQQARQLAGLLENEGMALRVVPEGGDTVDGRIWAELIGDEGCYAFATFGDDLTLGARWATKVGSSTHVEGKASFAPVGQPRDPANLLREPTSPIVDVDLRATAPGPAHAFGERFWSALEARVPEILAGRRLVRVGYRDRYLQSPGALAGLYAVLAHLQRRGLLGAGTRLQVVTLESDNERVPRLLRHDWAGAGAQRAVMEGLLAALGAVVEVRLLREHERRNLPHYRSLELESEAGVVEIRLDQGFGFLEAAPREERFPFDLGVDAQVSRLLGGSWRWEEPAVRGEVPAYVMRDPGLHHHSAHLERA